MVVILLAGGRRTRLLRTNGELRERGRQASHPPRTVPELVASRPKEVWSHDATALRGPARGVNYDLFVMLNIFSRCSPGWPVVDQESALVVRSWIEGVVAAQGPIPPGSLTIHSDRGSSMTSKPVAVLLADLRIGRTHSRPHVANDNPYSEAGFKTLKSCPAFPDRFGSLADARAFADTFFEHYNHHHRHSDIGYRTPASVHFGTAAEVRLQRAAVLGTAAEVRLQRAAVLGTAAEVRLQRAALLGTAYAAHPERFVRRAPTPPPLPGRPGSTGPRTRRTHRGSREDVSQGT